MYNEKELRASFGNTVVDFCLGMTGRGGTHLHRSDAVMPPIEPRPSTLARGRTISTQALQYQASSAATVTELLEASTDDHDFERQLVRGIEERRFSVAYVRTGLNSTGETSRSPLVEYTTLLQRRLRLTMTIDDVQSLRGRLSARFQNGERTAAFLDACVFAALGGNRSSFVTSARFGHHVRLDRLTNEYSVFLLSNKSQREAEIWMKLGREASDMILASLGERGLLPREAEGRAEPLLMCHNTRQLREACIQHTGWGPREIRRGLISLYQAESLYGRLSNVSIDTLINNRESTRAMYYFSFSLQALANNELQQRMMWLPKQMTPWASASNEKRPSSDASRHLPVRRLTAQEVASTVSITLPVSGQDVPTLVEHILTRHRVFASATLRDLLPCCSDDVAREGIRNTLHALKKAAVLRRETAVASTWITQSCSPNESQQRVHHLASKGYHEAVVYSMLPFRDDTVLQRLLDCGTNREQAFTFPLLVTENGFAKRYALALEIPARLAQYIASSSGDVNDFIQCVMHGFRTTVTGAESFQFVDIQTNVATSMLLAEQPALAKVVTALSFQRLEQLRNMATHQDAANVQ